MQCGAIVKVTATPDKVIGMQCEAKVKVTVTSDKVVCSARPKLK